MFASNLSPCKARHMRPPAHCTLTPVAMAETATLPQIQLNEVQCNMLPALKIPQDTSALPCSGNCLLHRLLCIASSERLLLAKLQEAPARQTVFEITNAVRLVEQHRALSYSILAWIYSFCTGLITTSRTPVTMQVLTCRETSQVVLMQ